MHPTTDLRATKNLLAASLIVLMSSVSCAAKTGLVAQGPHRPNEEKPPVRVDKRPPPIKIEVLPLRRNNKCYYRDGYWSPEGSSWHWTKGAWVLPAKNCYYAPPYTRYEELDAGTTLVHRAGVWHERNGPSVCAPPLSCPSRGGAPE